MKTTWYNNKWIVILLHTAAWVLLFSLPYLLRPPYDGNKARHVNEDEQMLWLLTILGDAILVTLFYFNARIAVPRLIYRRKYWTYTLLFLGVSAMLVLINRTFIQVFARHTKFYLGPTIFFTFFPLLFVIASSLAYQMIRDKSRNERLIKERENENLKSELTFLRSQVSPHFMFNVLNNMVSLARKQSAELEPSLIKLSSLMRYMLYEADESKVALEKEIEYLQSYIDLQQQRFGSKVKVTVSLDAPSNRYDIEPMLLIPFVENAFKHGTGMISDGDIRINLYTTPTPEAGLLHFSVCNRYDHGPGATRDKDSGIGLPNVKRRLNLLYGDAHSLMVTQKDGWFLVSLQLNLH